MQTGNDCERGLKEHLLYVWPRGICMILMLLGAREVFYVFVGLTICLSRTITTIIWLGESELGGKHMHTQHFYTPQKEVVLMHCSPTFPPNPAAAINTTVTCQLQANPIYVVWPEMSSSSHRPSRQPITTRASAISLCHFLKGWTMPNKYAQGWSAKCHSDSHDSLFCREVAFSNLVQSNGWKVQGF